MGWGGVRSGVWALVVLTPSLASGQTVVGYQVGLTQSAGGTFGDDLTQIQQRQQNPAQAGAEVQSLQGIQLNTTVTGNLTVDMIGNVASHGLVFGVAASQLLPFAVPDTAQAALRQQLSTLAATATYLARVQQARWNFNLGGGYTFNLNGRLQSGADGSLQGGVGGGGTLPAASAGAFAFNGISHTFNALTSLQLVRTRWDLTFGLNYTYTQNGVYSLAAGALGAQAQGGAAGTNVGAFIPANLHTISPQLAYRTRIGRRGNLNTSLITNVSLAQEIRDDVTVTGTVTTIVPGPPPPPQTIVNTALAEYAYNFDEAQALGASLTGIFSLRLPTDARGVTLPGAGLGPDTLITTARVFYRDDLPWALRLEAGAGVAQAHLLQAPLGAPVAAEDFEAIHSDPQPIADLRLTRRFEPVDVVLAASRAVGVGALGASALVADAASLTFTYTGDFSDRRVVANLGFNAQRARGVGREAFEALGTDPRITAAFNNQGFGLNAGLLIPLFESGGFFFDSALTYTFTYSDTDPQDVLGIDPLRVHAGLFTLRGTWGRGTAQGASGAGGASDSDELDAFSANPRDGSPLTTARLVQQGARNFDLPGQRPGQGQAEARRDSRQAYQQSLRQQKIEQDARDRSAAVQGTGSYQEEERRAQEREKKAAEAKEEERSRSFGEVPFESVPLPEEPATEGE